MSAKGTLGFILGSIVGAVAGATAGLLLAPRTGAESRAMAADAMNDAWDSAVDAYERGSRVVSDKISNVRPSVDAVNTTSAQVQDAVNTVAEKVGAEDDRPAEQEAQSVQVEVVDVSEPTDLEDEAKNSQSLIII